MEEFKPHRQGQKYKTEEDRRRGRSLAQHKYSTKRYYCNICNIGVTCGNKLNHEKTKNHQSKLS